MKLDPKAQHQSYDNRSAKSSVQKKSSAETISAQDKFNNARKALYEYWSNAK